jgi:prevent-host-death family protein
MRRSAEVGVRELRNHTSDVIDRVISGEELHLTVYGRRVAVIVPEPPEMHPNVTRLLTWLSERPPTPTGWAEEHLAQRAADTGTDTDPWG